MSKKEFILQIIDTFEQKAENLPNDLHGAFGKIKEELYSLSDAEVESQTTSVVTTPNQEKGAEDVPEWISSLLYESLEGMEKISKQAEVNQSELLQACNLLRGELGMDTDPPFPA